MATPLRLLLIEDAEDDAQLLMRDLRRAEYDVSYERVDTAAKLESAFDHGSWDIVISDYTMPTFNGMDALSIVRRRAPELPFIFVSGTIGEDTAVSAMRAGAHDYVMKGNLRRLIPAIERELREAKVRRRERGAAEQLRAASELLRSVFAASPLAIIASDRYDIVKLWNPAAERLFGWTDLEVVGHLNPAIPPEEVESRQALRQRALAGEVITNLDVKRRRKDGSLVPVTYSIAPTYDGNGRADGVTTIHEDLSDRKQLEARALEAKKMEAIAQLAGGVAHDFNNLLTVIASYSDLLLAETPRGDHRSRDLAEIRSAVDKATSLTQRLLAFNRQEVIEPKVVELNAVVSGAAARLDSVVGPDIEVVVRLDAAAGMVKIDAEQLEEVIMNLAMNAREAMPDGGVLRIETRLSGRVSESFDSAASANPHGYAVLTVADTGKGMDEATQARIFEPFFTTKARDKGAGLGLAAVYAIVKRRHGMVRVWSTLGSGTTIRIYLPAVGLQPVVPAPRKPAKATRQFETILLVEDEPAVRAVVRRVLDGAGYSVVEAPDGQTANRIAESRSGEIHLLVTDLVLPDSACGKKFAAGWAAKRPSGKVLFLANETPRVDMGGVLKGRHKYISKPFSPDALLRAVREVLA